MAEAYAALNRPCEATAPINMWVALDPATRDTSRTQKIISDYEAKGNCISSKEFQKESYPLRGHKHVVTVKAEINGVRGLFILDTGASYLTLRSSFADRAKIPQSDTEISMITANGPAKARLSKADKVMLGKLEATNVPVAVQRVDEKSYGVGVDGRHLGDTPHGRAGRCRSRPGPACDLLERSLAGRLSRSRAGKTRRATARSPIDWRPLGHPLLAQPPRQR